MSVSEPSTQINRRNRQLRLHFVCFASVVIALAVIDIGFSEARWFHWPAMAWAVVFSIHFLYCKSHSVDDEWAEERASRLRINSYDLGHIREIEDSYKKNMASDQSEAESNQSPTLEEDHAGEGHHDDKRGNGSPG